MKLRLFNTETRQLETITALKDKTLRMYTCGPTIYNFAHIGNFRTYVFEDVLRRSLKLFGFKVEQAMNLTDIDDKTIKGAVQHQISLGAFTEPYKKAFFEDLDQLGIERVEHYPEATRYINEMIALIEGLVNKGVAYSGQDGSIYFAIAQFPSYGRLAHLDQGCLKAGASNRVSLDEYDKEHVSDFVLWKAYDPERDGQIYWDSPFGKGRPGWHIECSAMAMTLLGESIDIHVGGVDNLFPHHENEIAQSEAYSGCCFARYWLHCEHLLVDHKKMSKSQGNFYTLRDLIAKGYTGIQVRYMLLQGHYRSQLNFTFTALNAAATSLQRLHDFIRRLEALQREKMQMALEAILERALPEMPQKTKERLLCDLQKEKKKDLFNAHEMAFVLERYFPSIEGKQERFNHILVAISQEQGEHFLVPIVEKVLKEKKASLQCVHTILAEVRQSQDLLDPALMKPILQKVFAGRPHLDSAVEEVLHTLTVKRSQGLVLPLIFKAMESFQTSLSEDLNLSSALAVVFDMVREVNALCDQQQVGGSEAEAILDCLRKMDSVLGVLFVRSDDAQSLPPELEAALVKREAARAKKEWTQADLYRDQIDAAGYLIEDTPQGARLKRKTP